MSYWNSEQGKTVQGYLRAYGVVMQERLATGDGAAVPTSCDTPTRSSSKPALPTVLAKALDVERWLAEEATRAQRQMVHFVYVAHLTYARRCQAVFADGSRSDWVSEAEVAPHAVQVDGAAVLVYGHDWSQYDDAALRSYAKVWGRAYNQACEAEHIRAAKGLARFLAL